MSLTPYEPSVDWWKQYYTGKKAFTIRGKGSHLISDPYQDLARVISTLAMKKGLKDAVKSFKRRSAAVRVTHHRASYKEK